MKFFRKRFIILVLRLLCLTKQGCFEFLITTWINTKLETGYRQQTSAPDRKARARSPSLAWRHPTSRTHRNASFLKGEEVVFGKKLRCPHVKGPRLISSPREYWKYSFETAKEWAFFVKPHLILAFFLNVPTLFDQIWRIFLREIPENLAIDQGG